ncbi:MAG: thioesterase family protein [Candidatus Aminicenantes bacterium]|nr:thioesterase family protein [Candidatus Aminicenantes bacterium]
MSRVKLKPLPHYPFSTEIKVRITDLNYGGHLGNDSLLSLIHEARVAFLAEHGFTEMNCGGVSTMMADASIVYQGEAFAGDILKFEVAAGEATRIGFRVFFRATRVADDKPIALAETGIVCFDYTARKIQPLPEAVKALCVADANCK